jgi:ribose transport system substrate-binding protein
MSSSKSRALGISAALLVAVAGLAACGSDSGSDSGSAGGGDYTIALVPGSTASQFYLSMRDGAEAEAEKLGVEFIFQGASEFNPSEQTQVLNALAAKAPDAIVIAPTDPEALSAPLQALEKQGTKIITVDTTLADAGIVTSAITSDNAQGGAIAADKIASTSGEDAVVAVLGLTPTATTINARVDGFVEHAEQTYPDMQVLDTEFTGDEASKAQTTLEALFLANPDINAVFAPNQPAAEGATAAVKARGLEGKVTIVGYDSSDSQVSLLKSGAVSALVLQQPALEGEMGVKAAFDALEGSTPEKSQVLENVLAETSNADDPSITKYYY